MLHHKYQHKVTFLKEQLHDLVRTKEIYFGIMCARQINARLLV